MSALQEELKKISTGELQVMASELMYLQEHGIWPKQCTLYEQATMISIKIGLCHATAMNIMKSHVTTQALIAFCPKV